MLIPVDPRTIQFGAKFHQNSADGVMTGGARGVGGDERDHGQQLQTLVQVLMTVTVSSFWVTASDELTMNQFWYSDCIGPSLTVLD